LKSDFPRKSAANQKCSVDRQGEAILQL